MIDLALVKKTILEAKKITDAMDRATQKVLEKFGAFVRQRAMHSVRKRKAVSKPGQPPSSHLGLIRDHILFQVELASKNVVIGPMKMDRISPTALQSLEHGGSSLIMHHGKTMSVMIQKRPFMQPAFDVEKEKAAEMFRNSL